MYQNEPHLFTTSAIANASKLINDYDEMRNSSFNPQFIRNLEKQIVTMIFTQDYTQVAHQIKFLDIATDYLEENIHYHYLNQNEQHIYDIHRMVRRYFDPEYQPTTKIRQLLYPFILRNNLQLSSLHLYLLSSTYFNLNQELYYNLLPNILIKTQNPVLIYLICRQLIAGRYNNKLMIQHQISTAPLCFSKLKSRFHFPSQQLMLVQNGYQLQFDENITLYSLTLDLEKLLYKKLQYCFSVNHEVTEITSSFIPFASAVVLNDIDNFNSKLLVSNFVSMTQIAEQEAKKHNLLEFNPYTLVGFMVDILLKTCPKLINLQDLEFQPHQSQNHLANIFSFFGFYEDITSEQFPIRFSMQHLSVYDVCQTQISADNFNPSKFVISTDDCTINIMFANSILLMNYLPEQYTSTFYQEFANFVAFQQNPSIERFWVITHSHQPGLFQMIRKLPITQSLVRYRIECMLCILKVAPSDLLSLLNLMIFDFKPSKEQLQQVKQQLLQRYADSSIQFFYSQQNFCYLFAYAKLFINVDSMTEILSHLNCVFVLIANKTRIKVGLNQSVVQLLAFLICKSRVDCYHCFILRLCSVLKVDITEILKRFNQIQQMIICCSLLVEDILEIVFPCMFLTHFDLNDYNAKLFICLFHNLITRHKITKISEMSKMLLASFKNEIIPDLFGSESLLPVFNMNQQWFDDSRSSLQFAMIQQIALDFPNYQFEQLYQLLV